MSAVFDRVSRLYRAGERASPPALWRESRIQTIEQFTPAAVLIAITEREEPGMLFLHRPSNMRAHPGQVAFPGGRIDPGETPIEAALREAWEELGIRPEDVQVIGPTDVYRTGSGYEITPVVGVVPADLKIVPNPAEVAQWFEAPAGFVLDPVNQARKTIEVNGVAHRFIEINWQGHRIWGVTGAIVRNLAGRLRWHD